MKKIFALFLTLVFLLGGCASNESVKPVKSFSENAGVKFRNFTYDCTVVYNGKAVTLSAQSTSAAGLVLTYDGKTLGITYDDISLSQIDNHLNSSNPAIAIYEAIEYVNNTQESDVSTVKNGFVINGETSLGDFTLETDGEFYPVSLVFKDAELSFDFKSE